MHSVTFIICVQGSAARLSVNKFMIHGSELLLLVIVGFLVEMTVVVPYHN